MACSVCRSDKRESPMNLAPMIRIGLTMDAGRVRHVALDAARYSPAQKLFIGIPAREVPARAATVFALCPMAQSLAAELAIAAAHGEKPVVDRKRAIALGAERLGENLRSLVLSWPGATPDRDALAALRGALGALRGLADCTNAEMQTRIANLRQSATVLGFGPDDANETRWFSRLLRDISKTHSVIVVEHDMQFVRDLGVRVTCLHEGSVLSEGSLDHVSSDQRVIEVYLGR